MRIVQRNNDDVLVDADLAPGTMVVTEGVQLLRAGAPFRFEGDAAPAGRPPRARHRRRRGPPGAAPPAARPSRT